MSVEMGVFLLFTFSNISLLSWKPLKFECSQLRAISLAIDVASGMPIFSRPWITMIWSGGHAFGLSHCSPVISREAGKPPTRKLR